MPARDAKRILVYRLGSLGDHLIAVPAYRVVRRAFPKAEIRLLTNVPVAAKAAAAEAVLAGSGLVDSYEPYTIGLRNPLRLLKLIVRLRRFGADALVYLAGCRGEQATRRDRLFFTICGIREQIGLPLTADLANNRLLAPEADGTPRFEPEAQRLARCIAELGDAGLEDGANWGLNLSEAEREDAKRLLMPLGGTAFFAFSIGTKAQANHWGEGNWSEFFRALAGEHPGTALVMLGAPNEAAVSEAIADAWRNVPGAGMALNLCGASSPRVSAAVLEQARMYFGHDSGPAHLAASSGTPLVGVYAARNPPGVWFPHGPQSRVLHHWVSCGACGLETCVTEGKRCILSITVPEALAATREELAVRPDDLS